MGFKDIKSLYPNLDRDDYQPNSLDLRLDKICEIPLALDEGVVGIFGSTKLIPRPKEIAKEAGMDDGFGRGTKGIHVISSIVKMLKARGKV